MRGVSGTLRFLKGMSKLRISEIKQNDAIKEGTVILKLNPKDAEELEMKEGSFKVEVDSEVFDELAKAAVIASCAESSSRVVAMAHSLLTDEKAWLAYKDKWLRRRSERLKEIRDFVEVVYDNERAKMAGKEEEMKKMEEEVGEEQDEKNEEETD